MAKISLKEIVDDILLLVRNNNISESEDLSRAQIISWVKGYKHQIWRDRLDKLKEKAQYNFDWLDLVDDMFLKVKEVNDMELENAFSPTGEPLEYTKVTVDTLPNVFNESEKSILAIHDQNGENIQYMNHVRRHYNYYRKYTFGEMTAYYKDDGHIYVLGLVDQNRLKYIQVLYLYEELENDEDNDESDEDDVKIPAWMVPTIKERILKNELSFMLNRPSDDSNNATLASVKPHGPQDDEE